MQGIQSFDYKLLLGHLHRLHEAGTFLVPCEHSQLILEQEERLIETYRNYLVAVEDVAMIIRQFEEQKLAIRRLVTIHKNCRIIKQKRNINNKSQVP
jgi:hypothetical protein